jgi:hypothetical protein
MLGDGPVTTQDVYQYRTMVDFEVGPVRQLTLAVFARDWFLGFAQPHRRISQLAVRFANEGYGSRYIKPISSTR